MRHLRESVARGTPDFPFSRYRMANRPIGTMFTPIHWHPELEILYMQAGAAELLCGSNYIKLTPGDIAFVPPNHLHSIKSLESQTYYEAFVFSPELISLPETHFFQQQFVLPLVSGVVRLPSVLKENAAPYNNVRSALERICNAAPNTDEYKATVFRQVMDLCITLIPYLQPITNPALRKANETVKSCLAYMDQHYAEKLTLQSLAEQVHLHPNYLCALFKEHTGQTVFQHLIQIRIETAAKLLRSDNTAVSQVAGLCGFDSTGFFSKKFKQIMGSSPKEYSIRRKNNFEN